MGFRFGGMSNNLRRCLVGTDCHFGTPKSRITPDYSPSRVTSAPARHLSLISLNVLNNRVSAQGQRRCIAYDLRPLTWLSTVGMTLEPSTMSGEDTGVAKEVKSKTGKELAKLKFEKKNQSMAKLPSNLTVERRPLIHAPVASPFAGRSVQKVVYVSCNTPIMAAVKRVKKLLLHVEKRSMQGIDLTKDRNAMRKLAEANEKLGKNGEAVLVKASGRAMEQALKVGEWFRDREDELACNVDVRTGSVQAVDDIVERETDESTAEDQPENVANTSAIDVLDTSLLTSSERPEGSARPPAIQPSGSDGSAGPVPANDNAEGLVEDSTSSVSKGGEVQEKRKRRRKRKKSILDEETSARIRWVKTVEVAISLKC